MAAPGVPLVTVETLDELKVVAGVPESDVNRLSAGQEVRIRVDAAGATLAGVIAEINRTAAGPGRTYSMRVLFTGETDGARPGMYARVLVPSGDSGPSVAVPERAIVHRGQLTGIYALTPDDHVVLRWVRLGRASDGRVEVLSGLAAGERYVIPDGERLRDGQLVDVRPSLSAAAPEDTNGAAEAASPTAAHADENPSSIK
jgi:RND family efflux transporter MFP subunit